MGIVSNGSFWIYDVEELRSQDPNWPTHNGWGEQIIYPDSSTTWQVPNDVSSISVVMIGGGGQGSLNPAGNSSNTGGGGGQLVYLNDIPVTPGANIYFGYRSFPYGGQYDGGTGGSSPYMIDPSSPDSNTANTLLMALGGGPGRFYGATNTRLDSHGDRANVGGGSPESIASVGAHFVSNFSISASAFTTTPDGGGAGGHGSNFGSGGAGGYSGKGGNAATTVNVAAENGTGGGGAGTQRYVSSREQHIGGGVFPFGTGLGNSGVAPYVPGGSPSSRTYSPSRFKMYGSNTASFSNTFFNNLPLNHGFVHNLACGSFPTDPWPQYSSKNFTYGTNPFFEYGWGGGQCHHQIHAVLSNTNWTGVAWYPGIIRIVWPGNVRKFPSQHVQYVPNIGSTFQYLENTNEYSREDFIFTGYSLNNGYTAP